MTATYKYEEHDAILAYLNTCGFIKQHPTNDIDTLEQLIYLYEQKYISGEIGNGYVLNPSITEKGKILLSKGGFKQKYIQEQNDKELDRKSKTTAIKGVKTSKWLSIIAIIALFKEQLFALFQN